MQVVNRISHFWLMYGDVPGPNPSKRRTREQNCCVKENKEQNKFIIQQMLKGVRSILLSQLLICAKLRRTITRLDLNTIQSVSRDEMI